MNIQETQEVEQVLDQLEETSAPPASVGGPGESTIVDEGPTGEEEGLVQQTEEAQPEGPAVAVDSQALLDRLSHLEQQTRDQSMELAYLRGLNQQRAPQTEIETEDDDIPDDVFVESLRTNPAATLRSRENRLLAKVEKVIEKSLGQFAQTRESTDVDTQMMMKRYGTHYEGDPEFKKAVDQTLSVMQKEYGGYKPGLKSTAAAIVFGEFVRMGRIQVAPQEVQVTRQNGNGAPPATQVRETVRRVVADPMVRTRGAVPTGTKKDPLSGYSPDERKSILRTCERLGVTPEQWAAQVAGLTKRDPSYGRVA